MTPLPYAVTSWLRGIDVTARAMAYAVELDARSVTDAIELVWELDATSRGPTLAAALASDLDAIAIYERQTAAAAEWLVEARAIMDVECVR